MSEDTKQDAEAPVTADWLKGNTRIGGWLAFFLFALLVGGLRTLCLVYRALNFASCYGSNILAMTEVVAGVAGMATVILIIVSFRRRSPSAVFWAKYYVILCLLTSIIVILAPVDRSRSIDFTLHQVSAKDQAFFSSISSIIWIIYLHVSSRVEEVIPKQYRHSGFWTWAAAVLLALLPIVWMGMGVVDAALRCEPG